MKPRLLLVVVFLSGCSQSGSEKPFTPNPAKQQARLEFIQQTIRSGLIQKIEVPGSVPHAWVTPAFSRLSFDDKTKIIGVVFANYFPAEAEGKVSYTAMVVLKDSVSGNRIGKFSQFLGLRMN